MAVVSRNKLDLVGLEFRGGQYRVVGVDKDSMVIVECLHCGRRYSLHRSYVMKLKANPCKACRKACRNEKKEMKWAGYKYKNYIVIGVDLKNRNKVIVKCLDCNKVHSMGIARLYDNRGNPCECKKRKASEWVSVFYSSNPQYLDGKYSVLGRERKKGERRYKTVLKCNTCGKTYRVCESNIRNNSGNPCECSRKIRYTTRPGIRHRYEGRTFRGGEYTVIRRDREHKFKGHAIRYIIKCNKCESEYSVQDSKIISETANPCKCNRIR